MSAASDPLLFVGRFHILLVHLPIGAIVLLAFLELLTRCPRFIKAEECLGPILLFAVPASLATAACGWLLSGEGGYESRVLQWHQWMGLATAATCTLTGIVFGLGFRKLYRVCLLATLVLMVGASHFGGSLTHGKDFLFRHAPTSLRGWLGGNRKPEPSASPAGLADLCVFTQAVQPVLNTYCVGCHGPEKARADLRLDTLEGMNQGTHGPVFVAGDSEKSRLIRVLTLPVSDDFHMPPEGKPQPTLDAVSLLRWWIDAGASPDRTVGELNPPPDIRRILEAGLSGKTAPARWP